VNTEYTATATKAKTKGKITAKIHVTIQLTYREKKTNEKKEITQTNTAETKIKFYLLRFWSALISIH